MQYKKKKDVNINYNQISFLFAFDLNKTQSKKFRGNLRI